MANPGHISVTFDSGAGRGEVSVNPQPAGFPTNSPDTFHVRWVLDSVKGLPEGGRDWTVRITNVVPLNPSILPSDKYDFSSAAKEVNGRSGWQWDFTPKSTTKSHPKDLSPTTIQYELFFSVEPKIQTLQSQQASLRRTFSLDPSVLLPPQQSDGF